MKSSITNRLTMIGFVTTIVGSVVAISISSGIVVPHPDRSVSTTLIHDAGFTDVKFDTLSFGQCESSEVSISFTATARDGAPIQGEVCQKWFGKPRLTFLS